jgi:hypothetical protein
VIESATSDPPICTPLSLSSLQRPATSLTVAGDFIYWIVTGSLLAGVYRAPLSGGETMLITSFLSLQEGGRGWDLTADEDGVVFALESGPEEGGGGPILRIEGPSVIRDLAHGDNYPCRSGGLPMRIAVDATNVYWIESAGRFLDNPDGLTDPTCTSLDTFRFLRTVPKEGGPACTLGRIPSLSLLVDDEYIYSTSGDALVRLRKDACPGAAPSVLASGLLLGAAPDLARDGHTIYVGGREGRVYAVDRKTGAVRLFAGPSGSDVTGDFHFDGPIRLLEVGCRR